MLDGDPFTYFSDLLVLFVVVLPAYFLTPWSWLRQLLLGLTGAYLIFLIAPRLLLFYVLFWSLIFVLQHATVLFRDKRASWVWTTLLIGLALAPMVAWKLWPEWSCHAVQREDEHGRGRLSPWIGAIDRVREPDPSDRAELRHLPGGRPDHQGAPPDHPAP